MKEGYRSVFTALGVSAGCLCIWWGSNLRDRLDIGSSTLTASSSNKVLGPFVASRSNQAVVPAADYYSQMVSLLKQYYVEPIKSDEKLADGSVRGMVSSLGDPESRYMDADEFRAYMNRQKGLYEGIGVDLALVSHGAKPSSPHLQAPPQDPEEAVATLSRFPSVKVIAVVPGGPADRSGVKVGDVVADIDNHWVVEDTLLEKFKRARDAFQAKKITYSEILPIQKEVREKTERALLPARTLAKLMVGKTGNVAVTWNRDGVERKTTIDKAQSEMPGFSAGDTIVLPMSEDAARSLKDAISGRPAIRIDLRNDAEGSFSAMLSCLQTLAPNGKYGQVATQRQEDPTLISVKGGNPKPPKVELLVGPSTKGPAEVLAMALSSQGKASLVGTLSDRSVPIKQDVELPSGAGYDLLVGSYRSANPKSNSQRPGTVALKQTTRDPVKRKVYADRSTMKSDNAPAMVNGGLN